MYIESINETGEPAYITAEEVTLPSVSGREYVVLQPAQGDVPRTRFQLELLVGDYRFNAQTMLDLADKYQALLDELPTE